MGSINTCKQIGERTGDVRSGAGKRSVRDVPGRSQVMLARLHAEIKNRWCLNEFDQVKHPRHTGREGLPAVKHPEIQRRLTRISDRFR